MDQAQDGSDTEALAYATAAEAAARDCEMKRVEAETKKMIVHDIKNSIDATSSEVGAHEQTSQDRILDAAAEYNTALSKTNMTQLIEHPGVVEGYAMNSTSAAAEAAISYSNAVLKQQTELPIAVSNLGQYVDQCEAELEIAKNAEDSGKKYQSNQL